MMHVEMVTPGSAGTYYMKSFLGKNYNPLKLNTHRRNPKMPKRFKGRVVYLYSNPYDTILSYYRRGFLKEPYDHCSHIEGDLKGIREKNKWFLQEFLKNGRDFFQLGDHFRQWFSYNGRTYDILFIKYESLLQTLPQLIEWYELPKEKMLKKFHFTARNSSWRNQPREIQEGLWKIYGDHFDFLDNLNDTIYLRAKQ